MEQESINNEKLEEIGTILQILPEMMDKFRTEFELFLGKKLVVNLSSAELSALERKIKKLYIIAQQLEMMKDELLTPASAKKRLSLMNRYFRLTIRRIPRNQEPIDYLINSIERIRSTPTDLSLPEGLDYASKYDGLCLFIDELLLAVPKSSVNSLLSSGMSDHQFVPQFQRAFNNLSLPKGLKAPPSRLTMQTIEKLKLALHDVTTDWEGLIDLVYGLIQLKAGSVRNWINLGKVALWDKVEKVNQEPNLGTLAKPEWVTVRNTIDHGKAFFIPSERKIRFPDRNRVISWSLEQAYLEAVDIYLANQAMLRIWDIVQTAGIVDYAKQIKLLRALAFGRKGE